MPVAAQERHNKESRRVTGRRPRKSWEEKLRVGLQPRVIDDPKRGDRLLIATPLSIGEEIARVARGEVITFTQLRERLARRFGADRTCPLTTGIFAMILAGATSEDLSRQRPARWPIWRLVQDDGILHPKWPLDARYRATMLAAEGLRITRTPARWKVLRAGGFLESPGLSRPNLVL
jgi:hypothetical protein